MRTFRKKPVEIKAMTWDEFIQYGLDHPENNIVDGMPWSFEINGYPITHENDECYLIPTLEGTHHMTPKDMLIIGVKGEIYPCKKDIFEMTYDAIKGVATRKIDKEDAIEEFDGTPGYMVGGLRNKYIIQKSSGEEVDPKADYFVLRIDKDPHAQKALIMYARSVEKDNPKLADDIREKLVNEYGWEKAKYVNEKE